MNPMVDGWMGDDWFHNGAFREQNCPYIYEQTGTRANDAHWRTSTLMTTTCIMKAGSAGELAKAARDGADRVLEEGDGASGV